MLVVFPPIFVADTKLIYSYNFVAPLIICTSNHIFGRAIWGKLTECIFENFECPSKTSAISIFSNITKVIYPKNCPKQTCDSCLTTRNQQTLCIETNIF